MSENHTPYSAEQPSYPTTGQPAYGDPNAQYAQSQYGQSQYGQVGNYGVASADHPQTQLIFILGIVGIFVPIVAWIDWYIASQAKKQIAGGAPYRWEGNIKTGYTLAKVFSIIHIVLIAIGIVFNIIVTSAAMS